MILIETLLSPFRFDFMVNALVISAIVVGGTSIYGGEGAIWRTFLGILLFAMIGNGFTLLGVNPQIQQVVQGLILLGAVGLDSISRLRT